jgi:LL-diaminopimelate aminotransferase
LNRKKKTRSEAATRPVRKKKTRTPSSEKPLRKRKALISASGRISKLPPYLFAEIDRQKEAARRKGMELIDFGIGDPDTPTPGFIVEAAQRAVAEPACHRYPRGEGSPFFLEAIHHWMQTQFGVEVSGGLSAAAVIGTKEGLAHVPMVFGNPGDVVLVPNPGYPVYRAAGILADCVPVDLPLLHENGFVPDLTAIEQSTVHSARIMYVNYPNNPTGAVLTGDQMKRIVDFARTNDILVVSDNSYSHIRFDGEPPASFLQTEGASDVCLEFHSLSKTFNMTGWRIGFVVGGSALVRTFMGAKENIDSGVFTAIQHAGEKALLAETSGISERLEMYRARRELLTVGLEKLGWDVFPSAGTFYVWVRLPRGADSLTFARKLVSHAGIVVTPGSGFGTYGEGYIRFALSIPEDQILKALGRLEQLELFSHRMLNWLRKSGD